MNNSIFARTALSIKRSGWRAYAVIFMMSTTFVILGVLLTLIYTSNSISVYFTQKPEVIGFFKDDVTEEQVLEVKKSLESMDFVAEVRYVSKEEAMQSFIEDAKDNQDIIEGVTANVFPSHLNVKATSLDKISAVADDFKSSDLISDVLASENVVSTLGKIVFGIQLFGGTLLLVFTISTVLIIFLTTGITIYSQKSEIIIMKLVGATDWYVRAPFIYQGIFSTVVSILIASSIIIPLLLTQYQNVMSLALGDLQVSSIDFSVIAIGLSVELAFGILLSTISGYFATRRYINY